MKCVVVMTDRHLKSRSLSKAFFPSSVKGAALVSPFDHGLCRSRPFFFFYKLAEVQQSLSQHSSATARTPLHLEISLILASSQQKLTAWKTKRDAWPSQPRQHFPTHAKTRLIFPHETRSPPARAPATPSCPPEDRHSRGGSGGPADPRAPVQPPPIPRRRASPAQRQVYTKAGVQEGS